MSFSRVQTNCLSQQFKVTPNTVPTHLQDEHEGNAQSALGLAGCPKFACPRCNGVPLSIECDPWAWRSQWGETLASMPARCATRRVRRNGSSGFVVESVLKATKQAQCRGWNLFQKLYRFCVSPHTQKSHNSQEDFRALFASPCSINLNLDTVRP